MQSVGPGEELASRDALLVLKAAWPVPSEERALLDAGAVGSGLVSQPDAGITSPEAAPRRAIWYFRFPNLAL